MNGREFGDSLFGPDGTQAPPPPPVPVDPLAGLVTGALPTTTGDGSPVARLAVAAPVEPDEQVVRQAVDAALAQERPAVRPSRRDRPVRPTRPAPPGWVTPTGGVTGWTPQPGGSPSAFPAGGPLPRQRLPSTRIGAAPAAPGLPSQPAAARRSRSAGRTTGRVISWLVFLAIMALIVIGALHGNSGSFGG